jgi:LmbE family N-acetylglucosaminyl deacetylase
MKVLFVSPHADDAELGCGGTIAKLVRNDNEVHCVSFYHGESHAEFDASMRVLGIPYKYISDYQFRVRNFLSDRQAILDTLIPFGKQGLDPDVVFMPVLHDTHQDHQVVAEECLRAFKSCSILGYEEPWNNLQFSTNFYCMLKLDDLAKKQQALDCYKSQVEKKYMDVNFTESLARVRGLQAGGEYAEAFQVYRWIIR